MIRQTVAALALLSLAACGQTTAPGGGQTGAGSLSGGAAGGGGAARQVTLSDAERRQLEALVGQYLDHAAQNGARGFTRTAGINDAIAPLQPRGQHDFSANLRGGVSYRIIGACDNECTDLDLELRDAAGAVVASDVAPTDFPIVNITPPADGAYSVRIILKTCTIAPCYVGARVLQQ